MEGERKPLIHTVHSRRPFSFHSVSWASFVVPVPFTPHYAFHLLILTASTSFLVSFTCLGVPPRLRLTPLVMRGGGTGRIWRVDVRRKEAGPSEGGKSVA